LIKFLIQSSNIPRPD